VTRLRLRALLVLLALVAAPAGAQSAFFRTLTSFRVIRTERFEIIFPRESESSARFLAVHADGLYDEISAALGIDVPSRIPVVFNPHTDVFNGLYMYFPTPHIVLFDTHMNVEWTTFPDSLLGLFAHELAHAISLHSASPAIRGLRRVFGSWFSPALLAPQFATEGVAISFEGFSSFGRANDPLVRQNLRQALHEGEFLTPLQASGLYDLPLNGGFFYYYGGLFSAWLQDGFGMERYAELWQAVGRLGMFSLNPYRSGFFRIFRNVYGIEFLDAWAAFRGSFAIEGLEENPLEVLPRRYRFLSERHGFINRLASAGGRVFVLEGRERRVTILCADSGEARSLSLGVRGAYDIDVSACGATMLVSGYRSVEDRFEAIAVEYWTSTGRRTGRSFRGLYRARYFRDGVVGIRSDLHGNLVSFERADGGSEVLLRGIGGGILLSGPQVVDGDRIAVVAARGGARELLLYDHSAGELFRVESAAGPDSRWMHMRGLGVSEGRLFFSHNADDRMYKLAAVDLGSMQAVFSERDFSGGVFNPVSAGGAIYYRGAFFARDRLMRFPEPAESLSGNRVDLALVRLDRASFEPAESALPALAAAVWGAGGPAFDSRRYFAIRHMNPFHTWLPLPLIGSSGGGDSSLPSLDGFGLVSFMLDPTQRNFLEVMAFADLRHRMAAVRTFSWQNTTLGFPLTLNFSDEVGESLAGEPRRETRASLAGSLSWSGEGPWVFRHSLRGSFARLADCNGEASAYRWDNARSAFAVSTGFWMSNRRRRAHEMFGTGASANFSATTVATRFEPRVSGLLRATAESRVPVSLAAFGAYDASGMSVHGASRRHGQPIFAQFAPTEFRHPPGLSLAWLAGAEAAMGLFSAEIQGNISHLYFNRIFGSLAARGAVYDGGGHPGVEGLPIGDLRVAQSLVLRLGAVMSVRAGVLPMFLEPSVWGSFKLSNAVTGNGSLWHIGTGFNVRM